MRIPITVEVLKAYYSTVKDKSTYLGFMIRNEKLCIYSEVREVTYMSICNVLGAEDLSLRLPVETMNVLMGEGYLEIEEKEYTTGASKIITHYTNSGNKKCTVEIASEFADNEEQIKSFIKTITDVKYTIINDTSIFNNAMSLATIKSKDVGIKGVTFNNSKCFTIGNGFAAYRDEPTNLSLILPTSTIREIVAFCKGKSNVRLYQQGGYNIIFDGQNVLAWRRTRSSTFMDIPDTVYTSSLELDIDTLNNVFGHIKSDVSRCLINYKAGFIELNSQVGNYEIPLDYNNPDGDNIKVNYKIFSEVIAKAIKPVTLESNRNNIHVISGNGTHYYLGVSYD